MRHECASRAGGDGAASQLELIMIATRFNFLLPRTALAGAFLALAALLLFVIPEHSAGVAEAASKTKRACMKDGAVPEPKENPAW